MKLTMRCSADYLNSLEVGWCIINMPRVLHTKVDFQVQDVVIVRQFSSFDHAFNTALVKAAMN